MKFKNKVVLITGAAGGIGAAITKHFINEGAKICAIDISADALEKLASDLHNPENLLNVKTDISSEASCADLSRQITPRNVMLPTL